MENILKVFLMAFPEWLACIFMVVGLVVESTADLQKQRAKRANPRQFVRTGLFGFVRCPNYLGELLFWTGVFVTGFGALHGLVQWLVALVGVGWMRSDSCIRR